MSERIPEYGGVTFINWGRKSCPPTSKLIYEGQAAAPDYRTAGSGANYLCLPSDPQYDPKSPSKAHHSLLTKVWYEDINYPSAFPGTPSIRHLVPCAVCEAVQRVTHAMIPAAVKCPSSEWTTEYKGYIMSSANIDKSSVKLTDHFSRTTFICVDENSESFDSKPFTSYSGSPIFFTRVQCSGDGALGNCPPYKADKALSCVFCTK